nr:hypothetical protein [Tanacetum cinerariifolium]
INKLHQPWRSFAAVINKCLSGKSSDIRNSNAYKEYDAVTTGATPPKTKASIQKTKSSSDTTVTPPPTATADYDEEREDDDDQEEGSDDKQASDEEDDEGNGEENLRTNVGREERQDEEDEEEELYREVNINLGMGVQMADVHMNQEFEDSHVTLTPINPDGIESIFETTSQMDVQTPTSVAPLPVSVPTLTPSTIATVTTIRQAPTPPTTAPSTLLQDLPNFGSLFRFDHRLKTLEANFSEFMQTNQFTGAVFLILMIVQRYMDQQMNEAVKVAVQIQSDRLHDEAQAENDEFLKTIDENMQKIIKEQTSYAVAADLSKMELKKILIEKMEGNKSIHQSNEQINLYKALIKRKNPPLDQTGGPRDEDKERSQSLQALQRRKLPGALASQHKGADDQPIAEPSQHPELFSQQKKPPNPDRDWNKTLPATHGSIQSWISKLAKQSDSRSSFNELMDTLVDFFASLMNRLKVDTLTPELLAGPTYELMKGSCKSLQYPHNMLKPLPLIPNSQGRRVIPFDHFINNDLEYLRGGASSRKYTTSVTKTKVADYGHIKWTEDLVPRTISIIIQRRVEDLQLNAKIYQKKLNLTRPDSYRSDLKRKEAYIAYSNPRGFIYQNKDKQNRLIRIDELYKFSDGTLTDVRTALDDHLKGIRMQYLPQTIWRKSDKDKAAAIIQAIYKQLKTRRIMRSLERFVGGRLYEGDFRMLQRTI